MATLTDLRKKYPQYSDMSDQEFADAFYKKYYSDIPKDSFYEKINFSPKNSVSQPQNNSTWLPTNIEELSKSPYVQTTLGIGDKVANLMSSAANLFGAKLPYRQSGEGTSYDIGQFVGDIGAYGLASTVAPEMVPEFMTQLGASAKALPYVGKLVNPARRAAGAAAFGSLEDPENRLGSAGTSGAISLGVDTLAKAIPGLSALRPSRYFRNNLSPEELAKNLEITKGTNTPLGDVIGSPSLKRQYENVISKFPFSGVEGANQQVSSHIKNEGENILNELIGNESKENIGQSIKSFVKKARNEASEQKTKNYNLVNDLADKLDVKVNTENLSNVAKSHLEELKKSPSLMRKTPQNIISDLEHYSDNPTYDSLRHSDILRGNIREDANDYFKQGKNYGSKVYSSLKDALDKDIQNAIEKSGNKELKNAHENAKKFYAEKLAPLEDKELKKYTRKNGDADLLISHFIKKSPNDRTELLSTLTRQLPTKKINQLAYGYLSRSLENNKVNPLKLRSLYEGLGENQKKILFPDVNMRNRLENFTKLVNINTEPLTQMGNPKTGQRALDFLPFLLSHGLGAGAGYSEGGIQGGITGGVLGPLAYTNMARKVLTSEKVRENLVKKMIKQSAPKKSNGYLKLGTKSLAQAIANMGNNKTNSKGAS